MVPALRYAIWAIIIIVPLLMLMQLSAWTQSSNYRLRSITLASANSPLISTPGGNLGINIPLMTIDTNTGHLQFPKSGELYRSALFWTISSPFNSTNSQ